MTRVSRTLALATLAVGASTLGAGGDMAHDDNSKTTLVYEHTLPNVPGKSVRGVLVEYGRRQCAHQ